MSLAKGSIDSPMWKRGNFSRSSTSTLRWRWRRKFAVDEPAGPPPATTTSKSWFMEPDSYHKTHAWSGRSSVGPRAVVEFDPSTALAGRHEQERRGHRSGDQGARARG